MSTPRRKLAHGVGLYLLGVVAVGLFTFGVYVILAGRYRDFRL